MLPKEERKHKLVRHHATEDALELYSLKLLAGSDLDAVDEHLLVCSICRRSLDEVDYKISVLRASLRHLELQNRATELLKKKDGGKVIMFRLL